MQLINKTYGMVEQELWDEGFVPFPLKTDGKTPFISGITGYEGSPPKSKERSDYRRDYSNRNAGIAGYVHLNGVRDESRFILGLDNDDETGGALLELELGIGESLPATVSVSARGMDNPRRKLLFIASGHRLHLPSKILGGRIDIISDVQRQIAISGTHLGTGQPIVIYGKDGEPLNRPLKVSDIAEAPIALIEFLQSHAKEHVFMGEQDRSLKVEDFMAQLDSREPSHFAAQLLEELALNRNFGNSELYEYLTNLVIQVNLEERGTETVYNELHWCWHGRDHVSGDPEREWNHALKNAIQTHWLGSESETLEFTYREMMLRWVEEATSKYLALDLEERFFEVSKGRPNFDHCKKVCEVTGDKPIALAAAHLMQVNHEIPFNVKFKSSLGEDSLNQILVVLGGTGTGKSAVIKNAESPLYWRYPRLREYYGPTEPVSGEGANMAFMREVRSKRGAPPRFEWKDQARNQLFIIDEVGLLESRSSRQGSTMRETVLIHHSCNHISRAKADGTTMNMPAGQYKSNWVIACQAERSEFFFNEDAVAAGLAGRCVWVPVTLSDDEVDLDDDDWDYEASYAIEPFSVNLPNWGPNYEWPIYIEPTDELHKELRRARKLGQLGRVIPLESHSTRNKARLAAIIAISDGRLVMNDVDVELAEILTQISRKTYQEALKTLQAHKSNQNAQAGRSDGLRRHFGARRERELEVQHHASRIQEKLLERCGSEAVTIEDLRYVRKNNFKATTREEYWDEAIQHLASRSDLPEQLKEISSLEETRVRESDARTVITSKEN